MYIISCYSPDSRPFSPLWWIKKKAEQAYKQACRPLPELIATHTAMQIGDMVYESHWDTGCYAIDAKLWESKKRSVIKRYPVDYLDHERAKRLLGTPYGKLDIVSDTIEYFLRKAKTDHRGRLKSRDNGLFCTEYVLQCVPKAVQDAVLELWSESRLSDIEPAMLDLFLTIS